MNDDGQTPKRVLLVHTKGMRLPFALTALRDELLRRRPDLSVRYFAEDFNALTPVQRAARRHALIEASSAADIVLCEANVLPPETAKGGPAGQRRVLLPPPRLDLLEGEFKNPRKALPYTDIVVQNEPAYRAYYELLYPMGLGDTFLPVGLPTVDILASEQTRAAMRETVYDFIPQARDRKVVTISMHYDARAMLGNVDLPRMAAEIGDEYVLLLDAPGAFPALAGYGRTLADFLCNSERLFTHTEALAVADVLITTRFGDGVYFSATGDPFALFDRGSDPLPDDIAALLISSVADIPALLANGPDHAALERFRAAYLAPNPSGNTARLAADLLGERA